MCCIAVERTVFMFGCTTTDWMDTTCTCYDTTQPGSCNKIFKQWDIHTRNERTAMWMYWFVVLLHVAVTTAGMWKGLTNRNQHTDCVHFMVKHSNCRCDARGNKNRWILFRCVLCIIQTERGILIAKMAFFHHFQFSWHASNQGRHLFTR